MRSKRCGWHSEQTEVGDQVSMIGACSTLKILPGAISFARRRKLSPFPYNFLSIEGHVLGAHECQHQVYAVPVQCA